jgi:hypothetical protein
MFVSLSETRSQAHYRIRQKRRDFLFVIPGPSKARSPKSILTIGAEDAPLSIRLTGGYGFRARAFGASRNDEVVREREGVRQCFRYPDVRASARGTV